MTAILFVTLVGGVKWLEARLFPPSTLNIPSFKSDMDAIEASTARVEQACAGLIIAADSLTRTLRAGGR